jgi:hypothetical protein
VNTPGPWPTTHLEEETMGKEILASLSTTAGDERQGGA